MRPKQHATTGSADLFRARLDRIVNLKPEPVQLAAHIEWVWIAGEIAPPYSDQGRPGIATRFVIWLLLLERIYGLSDEGVCEGQVHDPYFQYFTEEHDFPQARSDFSHWRKRLGDRLEPLLAESLRVAQQSGAAAPARLTGRKIERAYVGKGHHSHHAPHPHRVFIAGRKHGVFGAIKHELLRRTAIEPAVGHTKAEGHLAAAISRKSPAMPPTLSSTPLANIRLVLAWLGILLRLIQAALWRALATHPTPKSAS